MCELSPVEEEVYNDYMLSRNTWLPQKKESREEEEDTDTYGDGADSLAKTETARGGQESKLLIEMAGIKSEVGDMKCGMGNIRNEIKELRGLILSLK